MAPQSLKGVMQQVAALTQQVAALASLGNLAKVVQADGAGNVTITVPTSGSFAVRQGGSLRIAVDNRGNVGLFGSEAGVYREGGGQANLNTGGLHLVAPGGKASIWLHQDGTITVVGDLQVDLDAGAAAPVEAAFSVATDAGA